MTLDPYRYQTREQVAEMLATRYRRAIRRLTARDTVPAMTTPETPQMPQQTATAPKRRLPWQSVVGIVLGTLALALAGGWYVLQPSTADKAGQKCEELVRGRLKAPATAQFVDVTVADWRGGHWRVSGQVDAQNGFGALVRGPFACELYTTDGGGEWAVNSLSVS